MTRALKINPWYALLFVAGVFVVAYVFLYTTDSYKAAVSTLDKCSPNSNRVAIINPALSTVRRNGESGTAEYQLTFFGTGRSPNGGTVGLVREGGVWLAKYVLLDGQTVALSTCVAGERRSP